VLTLVLVTLVHLLHFVLLQGPHLDVRDALVVYFLLPELRGLFREVVSMLDEIRELLSSLQLLVIIEEALNRHLQVFIGVILAQVLGARLVRGLADDVLEHVLVPLVPPHVTGLEE